MRRFRNGPLLWGLLLCLLVALCPARLRANVTETTNTIVISNEAPGYLITKLINAGYGAYTPYQALQYLASLPGASAAIPSSFLATLQACPSDDQIFTTTLSQYSAIGSGIAVSTDGTVRVASVNDSTYTGQSGATTISTGSTAVQNVRMVYGNPVTSWTSTTGPITTTYNALAIAWALADTTVPALSTWGLFLLTGLLAGAAALCRSTRCRVALLPLLLVGVAAQPARAGINTTQETFVLSNEGSGLITQLVHAGYGNLTVYQALLALQVDTDPSISGILTEAFLGALAVCPASSQIFTMNPGDLNVSGAAYAISTDGTVRAVSIFGSTYYKGSAGTATLVSNIGGVSNGWFTYSTTFDSPPLTSFSVTSGLITTTYNVTGIAWAPSTSVPTLSQWGLLLLTGLLAGAAVLALWRNTRCRAAVLPLLLVALAAMPARAGTTINTGADALIISNEAPGYLITRLINAGYGGYTLYQVVQLLAGMSGASAAISSDFLAVLQAEPASAEIFTATLSQYSATGSGIAIGDNGTVQVVSIIGGAYTGQSGTTTISTGSTVVQNVRMVYGNTLTSWTRTTGLITTTYKVFSIAWALADTATVPAGRRAHCAATRDAAPCCCRCF